MRSGYAITVTKNGEPILTIENKMLSGIETFSDEDADAVRDGATSLLAFIGPDKAPPCFACGGTDKHKDDCPIAELASARD